MGSVDLGVMPCPALCHAEDVGDRDKGCMHGDLLHTQRCRLARRGVEIQLRKETGATPGYTGSHPPASHSSIDFNPLPHLHTQRDVEPPGREMTNREGRMCELHRAWGLGLSANMGG